MLHKAPTVGNALRTMYLSHGKFGYKNLTRHHNFTHEFHKFQQKSYSRQRLELFRTSTFQKSQIRVQPFNLPTIHLP